MHRIFVRLKRAALNNNRKYEKNKVYYSFDNVEYAIEWGLMLLNNFYNKQFRRIEYRCVAVFPFIGFKPLATTARNNIRR